jgi:hypothetical protein
MIHAQRCGGGLIRSLGAIAMAASLQVFAAEPVTGPRPIDVGADPMYMAVYGRDRQVASIRLHDPAVESLSAGDDLRRDLALEWRPEVTVHGAADGHR